MMYSTMSPGLSSGDGARVREVGGLVAGGGDPGDEGHKEDAPEDGGLDTTDPKENHCDFAAKVGVNE